MKQYKYLLGMFFLLIATTISGQEDLEIYLQTAAENNPGLKAKFNDYLASLELGPQAGALPDPQIAFAYFISPVETRVGPQRFRISASQMFPWFGTLGAREDLASQRSRAKYEQLLEAKSKLFNEVRSTYYNIYFNRRAISITRENLDILNTFRKLANIKVEAGMVSAVDEYRIGMEIGDLENQLALLIDQQHVLEVMFNNLLNADKGAQIRTPDVLLTDDLPLGKEQVLDSIMSRNHQLLVLAVEQEALGYQKELAQKQGKPSFSIGMDYTFIGQGENNLAGTDAFVFPMVGISIPLYRSKYRAMVNEAVYLQTSKEFELNDRMKVLDTVLEKAWKDYQDARRRIRLYMDQQALANQAMKLLETAYATDSGDFEEILRMERKVLRYGLELEKARSDKQAAISFIKYLMGQ